MNEQSVVLVKPDGVRRHLIGEIISRLEQTGLELVACKMVKVPEDMAMKHYEVNEDWYENIGNKIIKFYEKHGKDPKEDLGVNTPREIGEYVIQQNVNYLTEGPVVAMVWQGPHAVEVIRKKVGSTYPKEAAPGTIRGDFGYYSATLANQTKTPSYNLVHASGTPEEGEFERKLWFKEDEIYD